MAPPKKKKSPPKKKIKLSKKEKKIKLSKLRSFRHERNYDETYVNTFNTIHNQYNRISEGVNYEDDENFKLLPHDFEGFDENDFHHF